jgi:hypothetical protein
MFSTELTLGREKQAKQTRLLPGRPCQNVQTSIDKLSYVTWELSSSVKSQVAHEPHFPT